MSADVGPVLPPGIEVVGRDPAPDPRLVDAAGLLVPHSAQSGPEGIRPVQVEDRPADRRVAPHVGSGS